MRKALTHGTATALVMAGMIAMGVPAMAAGNTAPTSDAAGQVADSGISVEYGAPIVTNDEQGQTTTATGNGTAAYSRTETGTTPVGGGSGGQVADGSMKASSSSSGTESADGGTMARKSDNEDAAHEETHIGAIVGVSAGVVVIGAAVVTALARRKSRRASNPDDFDDLQETVID